jgi:hypothetical protein
MYGRVDASAHPDSQSLVNVAAGESAVVETVIANVTDPFGRVWLNGLIMVVIPLIVSTVAVGVAGLGSPAESDESVWRRSSPSFTLGDGDAAGTDD